MEEPKKEIHKPEVLTGEEIKILMNIIAQASVRVVDAPILINLSNKLSNMI